MKKKILFILFFLTPFIVFYSPVLLQNKLPIPSDNLAYLFYPFRDHYAQDFPRGVPYKNSLVADPVTQQIPWKILSMDEIKNGNVPLWNPYSMAGYPLLGNIQSSPFYPLNVLLFLPFFAGWTLFIILQQLLASLFLYLFVRNKGASHIASLFGSVAFSFSGFVISWLEWGTIIHTALWLPLLLLSLDKINEDKKRVWNFIFILGMCSAFLGGHLQTFIYLFLATVFYSFFINRKSFLRICILSGISFLILSPVIFVDLQSILLSARSVDLSWRQPGWFIPWQNGLQFIAPDFFGNPATGNYYGEWNYGEFIGYIGIFPLILAISTLRHFKEKKYIYFVLVLLGALCLAFPTIIAKVPYKFEFPFLSSTQPTRLLFLVNFSLAVLAVFGLDNIIKSQKRNNKTFLLPIIFMIVIGISIFLLNGAGLLEENIKVSIKNSIIPLTLLLSAAFVFFFLQYLHHKSKYYAGIVIIIITFADLLFFATKYTPFVSSEYFFPQTKAITFLQENLGQHRFMSTDRRIMHPNVSTYYKLQSLDGYDPLYLMRYGELMAATGRRKPDIASPFGFFRIITPDAFDTQISDLLGVKYVLSIRDLDSPNLKKVFQYGETQIYENLHAFPRVFFVEDLFYSQSKHETIEKMFKPGTDLRKTAIVEGGKPLQGNSIATGSAQIVEYTPSRIVIQTDNNSDGYLVLTDTYYPTWKAFIDNSESEIFLTDYHFRGIVVPKGKRIIEFKNTFLSI